MVAEAEKHAAGGWNEAGHHDQYPTCDVVVAERLGLGSGLGLVTLTLTPTLTLTLTLTLTSEALLGWINRKLRGAIWPSLAAQFGVDADDLWLQARAPHAHRVHLRACTHCGRTCIRPYMHAMHTGCLRRAIRRGGPGRAGDAHGRQRALVQPAALRPGRLRR